MTQSHKQNIGALHSFMNCNSDGVTMSACIIPYYNHILKKPNNFNGILKLFMKQLHSNLNYISRQLMS